MPWAGMVLVTFTTGAAGERRERLCMDVRNRTLRCSPPAERALPEPLGTSGGENAAGLSRADRPALRNPRRPDSQMTGYQDYRVRSPGKPGRIRAWEGPKPGSRRRVRLPWTGGRRNIARGQAINWAMPYRTSLNLAGARGLWTGTAEARERSKPALDTMS